MQLLRSLHVRWFLFGLLILAVVLPPLLLAGKADVPAPSRDRVHDTPQKANGSGVRVRYRADGLAVVGQPFAVTLYFDAVSDPAATLRLSTDAGLQMSMPTSELPLSLGASELALTVVPSADGLAYLNVFTAQRGAGGVTSIPVQTGAIEPRLPARGERKSDADGEPVITFKVP